ncbi:hypothetical protein J6590_065890 [Homalodisca vitripennis]|nr:hypothetical protein J6590_065890 [Homalodisca vitripennis]
MKLGTGKNGPPSDSGVSFQVPQPEQTLSPLKQESQINVILILRTVVWVGIQIITVFTKVRRREESVDYFTITQQPAVIFLHV